MPDILPLVPLDTAHSLQVLAIAVGLGGLVGLQREHAESRIAGIRTFPLITVLGTLSGLLAGYHIILGCVMIVISMVGVIAGSSLGNYLRARPWVQPSADKKEKTGAGITTEMAILVMYAVGVYLVFGPAVVAVAVTGGVVLLLYAKDVLHKFVDSLGEKDVHGIMQFVLLSCVILPVLPNESYGPYHVLNPRNIWLVVVLVVGISAGGYIAYRLVGARAGTVLSGLIGGLISSTATTASFARRAAADGGVLTNSALLAVMLASTVVYGRVLVELSASAGDSFRGFIGPLGAMAGVTLVLTIAVYAISRGEKNVMPQQENPTNLGSALLFGAIYAVVALASAAAQEHLGPGGYFGVAAVSGLSDMDAITLSSGRAVSEGRLVVGDAWRAVLIALMSSMVMKVLICGLLGNRRLAMKAGVVFGINIAAGVVILLLWPRG